MGNNKMWLILVAVMVLTVSTVSAAVTECVDASGNPQVGPGAYPMYNDTGVVTNVSAGKICVDATSYDVAPNVTYNCGNTTAMIDNACTYVDYYTGFLGDGTVTCTDAGWVAGQTYTLGLGTVVNTTINSSWEDRGNYITSTSKATPAKDACYNNYTLQGPTGYCDGAGALDLNSSLANVSAGNVCIVGADSQPNASVHCVGSADTWSDCVANACVINEYYVGYVGDGTNTCIDTDWALAGTSNPAPGYRVNNTGHSALCTYLTTGGTAVYSSCTNLYTRNGTSGYCDGAGGNATGTLHVADGKVCVAGVNTAPNATVKCGTWYNCVLGATSAPNYYVGYAASGSSCSDTAWVSASASTSFAAGRTALTTEHSASLCSLGGFGYTYTKSDFNPIVVDALGTVGAEFVSNAELVVIALVLMLFAGIIAKYKGVF